MDLNNYPPDYGLGTGNKYWSYLPRLAHLTTPIDYISSLPDDVFAQQGLGKGNANYANPYKVPFGTRPIARPLAFDYACRRMANGQIESVTVWGLICANPSAVMWALRSPGPKLISIPIGYSTVVYDPTNGTVSDRQIFFTGSGTGIYGPKR